LEKKRKRTENKGGEEDNEIRLEQGKGRALNKKRWQRKTVVPETGKSCGKSTANKTKKQNKKTVFTRSILFLFIGEQK